MEDILVSIVVPVYNVENYIRECIESIINQTYQNLEIILVDDGSTDSSGVLCNEYAKRDVRVVVFHQKNQGVVKARKRGFEYASGKYICFVDADDKIKKRMVEFLVNHIDGCDLITTGVDVMGKNGRMDVWFDKLPEGCYQTKEQMKYLLSNMIVFENAVDYGLLPFLVNKMYRTEIAKKVIAELDERMTFFEDREFLVRYILQSQSVKVIKESFYIYNYRENSAVNAVNETYMYNMNLLYCTLKNAVVGHTLEDEIRRQLEMFIFLRLSSIPIRMGFRRTAQCIQYIFPYTNLLEGKKYILYGAGKVGENYYRQIRNRNEGVLVLWVDKKWKNINDIDEKIYPIELIETVEYDCILLAVAKQEVAEEIKQELVGRNIPEEKIWWKVPILFTV